MTSDAKAGKKAGEAPRRETRTHLGAEGTVAQQGREGGRLPRDIGTRDELKRARSRPAGKTRVRKSDEPDKEGDA